MEQMKQEPVGIIHRISWRTWLQAWPGVFFALVVIMTTSLVLLFQFFPNPLSLNEGDVAWQTIRANRRVTYTSAIRTREARDRALAAVADVYEYDPGLGVQQRIRAYNVLNYITRVVRDDPLASSQTKRDRLLGVSDLTLTPASVTATLTLNDMDWQEVFTETIRVLEEVMRERIRPDQLSTIRAKLPNRFDPGLDPQQIKLATELVSSYLKPNETLNQAETNRLRREALDAVEPARFTIEKGEVVVREGNVVTALDLEKLEALGLRQPQLAWPDIAANVLLAGLIVLILVLYLSQNQPALWQGDRRLWLLTLTILGTILLGKAAIPGNTLLSYFFPLPTVALILALLIDSQTAFLVIVLLSLVIGIIGGDLLLLSGYGLLGSTVALLTIRHSERLSSFFRSGLYIALTNVTVLLAFLLPSRDYDLINFGASLLAATANGFVSALLGLGGFAFLSHLFGITTSLQLQELAHPTHPLLRRLVMEAPGTYHHSIIVANLAERAAEAIGADVLLVRVGSYYHDVGKIVHPYFFIENQVDGGNIHDHLDPKTSARNIIAHVSEGIALAHRYKLPKAVIPFIAEHHGTSLTGYFYNKALLADQATAGEPGIEESAGGINDDQGFSPAVTHRPTPSLNSSPGKVLLTDFRYPGPRPRSRETAIVMLADSVEATVRASRDYSPENMDRLIQETIAGRLSSGQLDECDLTLRDLSLIRSSFANVLQGVFHPRVEYPERRKGNHKPANT